MQEKKNIKILAIVSWYPSRVKPHLGTFVQRQTEAVARYAEMSALFVCADAEMNKTFDVESKIINDVFTVNIYYKKSKIPFLNLFRVFRSYRLGWKRILSDFGTPELIHLNILWPAGIFACYLKLFSGLKYILTENWTGYLDNDNSYGRSSVVKKLITRIISQNAELITPVSRDLQQAMQKHSLGSKFEIVYNVADAAVFYPSNGAKTSGKILFLHVSTTLDEQKNISGIIKAANKLSEKRNDFELKIVSEKDFSSHKKTANDMGILNKVIFFESSKCAKDIAEEMRKAHCFVLFSNYENLPVVICEAMMSGLPVISSTAGGVPEHINDEFGLLVQPRDTVGLCKAMEYMMDNIEKYNSRKIRDYAVKNFSYEAVGKKINEIYITVG